MKKNFLNKRKRNFFSNKISYLVFFTIFFTIFLYFFFNAKNLIFISSNIIQKYSNKYNYNLLNIEISNLDYLDSEEILEYFYQYKKQSIFLVPLKKIANEIERLKWIKTINIKNDYKNTLLVLLEEEEPMGIYNNNNQNILFSKNLIILEILKNDNNYDGLIKFYGKNSINNSKFLLSNIGSDFADVIDSAIFVKNRRWNLKLNNSILLKLPEDKLINAIKNYKKIYANFSNKDLEGIESIDLRIHNQAIIKYKK